VTKELNYKQMVKDIDRIVNNDWCADMEMRYKTPNAKEVTQQDAHDILEALLNVYDISHQRTCIAHDKYREDKDE